MENLEKINSAPTDSLETIYPSPNNLDTINTTDTEHTLSAEEKALIEQNASTPEEALAVQQIVEIIGQKPGLAPVFENDLGQGITPEESLKQYWREQIWPDQDLDMEKN